MKLPVQKHLKRQLKWRFVNCFGQSITYKDRCSCFCFVFGTRKYIFPSAKVISKGSRAFLFLKYFCPSSTSHSLTLEGTIDSLLSYPRMAVEGLSGGLNQN